MREELRDYSNAGYEVESYAASLTLHLVAVLFMGFSWENVLDTRQFLRIIMPVL